MFVTHGSVLGPGAHQRPQRVRAGDRALRPIARGRDRRLRRGKPIFQAGRGLLRRCVKPEDHGLSR
ncbi:MAG: hypothetical protein DMF86_07315 [Acidobacteria bacterium]|nr:MAG: hypothetical protein DMF86_07315 [Acidobacteriota bacterium]